MKKSPPVAAVIMDHEWVGGQGLSVHGYGRMILPCSEKTLADSQVSHKKVSKVRINTHGYVVGLVECVYGGVEIGSQEEVLTGTSLIEGLTELILRGTLLKGVLPVIETAVFYVQLASSWPSGYGNKTFPAYSSSGEVGAVIAGSKAFIRYRLKKLGVCEPDDVQLLDDSSFTVDLESVTGLDYFELTKLKEEFPQTWSYEGADFLVEVLPGERKVFLVASNKASRKMTTLPHLVIPSFQGFLVYIRKGTQSRKIRG